MHRLPILILLTLLVIVNVCCAEAGKDPRTQRITRQQFLQLSAKTPINSRIHGRLIIRAMGSGLIDVAYGQYDKLWRKQPNNPYATYWRANTALNYWNKITSSATTARLLSSEKKSKLWQIGSSGLRDAVRLKPDLSWANASYGNFLFDQSQEKEGLRLMRKATILEPKNPALWFVLGSALINPYRSAYNPKEGEQSLLKATRIDPLYAAPHLALVRLYVSNKRFADAKRELQLFENLVPAKDAKQVSDFWMPDIGKGMR